MNDAEQHDVLKTDAAKALVAQAFATQTPAAQASTPMPAPAASPAPEPLSELTEPMLEPRNSIFYEDGSLFHTKKGRAQACPQLSIPCADTHGHIHCLSERTAASALARAAYAGVGLLICPIDPLLDEKTGVYTRETIDSWIETTRADAKALITEAEHQGHAYPHFSHVSADAAPLRTPRTHPLILDHNYIIAGVHPYGASAYSEEIHARLAHILESPYCVGVGEIGIDFGPYNTTPVHDQIEAFTRQYLLARALDLPTELHIRDRDVHDSSAHDLCYSLLKTHGVNPRGVILHCFCSTPEVMKPFCDLGVTIAFGGVSTFASAEYVRQALVSAPQRQIVTETDCPYMAPVPLRGCENEPACVAFTALAAAKARFFAKHALEAPADLSNCAYVPQDPAFYQEYAHMWNNACRMFSLDDMCIRL